MPAGVPVLPPPATTGRLGTSPTAGPEREPEPQTPAPTHPGQLELAQGPETPPGVYPGSETPPDAYPDCRRTPDRANAWLLRREAVAEQVQERDARHTLRRAVAAEESDPAPVFGAAAAETPIPVPPLSGQQTGAGLRGNHRSGQNRVSPAGELSASVDNVSAVGAAAAAVMVWAPSLATAAATAAVPPPLDSERPSEGLLGATCDDVELSGSELPASEGSRAAATALAATAAVAFDPTSVAPHSAGPGLANMNGQGTPLGAPLQGEFWVWVIMCLELAQWFRAC